MSAWRFKRQLAYILAVFLFFALPIGYYIYSLTPESTCFDGIKNQDEFDIDCGGICNAVCAVEVAPFVINWQRALFVRDGVYDIAASIENPNAFFAARSFTYTFTIYDSSNRLIDTVRGSSFANAREKSIIFEPQIKLGSAIPRKVIVEIENIRWNRVPNDDRPRILIKDEKVNLIGSPKLTATISNDTPVPIGQIEAVATIFNDENNIIGVSSTVVRNLTPDNSQRIVFTWPEEFREEPRICLKPVEAELVFDRSGSMNDDEGDPPQPISDAKNAARLFVNSLSSRDKIGLVSFATEASIDQELTNNFEKMKNSISNSEILPEDEVGSTNLGEALLQASRELGVRISDDEPKKVIVALTDGRANAPENPGGEEYAKIQASEAILNGLEIYTIGLGAGADQGFLEKEVASRRTNHFVSATSKDLVNVYGRIAENVCPDRIYLTKIFVRSLDANP